MTNNLSLTFRLNDCEQSGADRTRGHDFIKGYSKRKITRRFGPPMWSMAFLLTALLAGCGSGGIDSGAQSNATGAGLGTGVGGKGHGPAPLDLGMSGNFSILSVYALTNQPSSAVTGDVGLTKAAGSLIGLSCREVVGQIYTRDRTGPSCRLTDLARLTQGELDADNAFLDAGGRAPDHTELGAGNIGGFNLGPATYHWTTDVQIAANITLTGGPNDVWIFQMAQGLTVAPGVQIVLKGGALPQNIFWAPTHDVELGAGSQFKGVLLPAAAIFMRNGASINGKLLAAQVHLDQNTVGP
jgi:Ice-binding-like